MYLLINEILSKRSKYILTYLAIVLRIKMRKSEKLRIRINMQGIWKKIASNSKHIHTVWTVIDSPHCIVHQINHPIIKLRTENVQLLGSL